MLSQSCNWMAYVWNCCVYLGEADVAFFSRAEGLLMQNMRVSETKVYPGPGRTRDLRASLQILESS